MILFYLWKLKNKLPVIYILKYRQNVLINNICSKIICKLEGFGGISETKFIIHWELLKLDDWYVGYTILLSLFVVSLRMISKNKKKIHKNVREVS